MHISAMNNAKRFFKTYVDPTKPATIIEIGSQDVNGSLKAFISENHNYIGFDFQEGKNVDVVLQDAYSLPLEDNSVDICITSSCFEHSEFFWLVALEIFRVLKPDGIMYMNAPSNGKYHGYPVDCWRFYPDSGLAITNWLKRNKFNSILLESFISNQEENEGWNDFVAIILKDQNYIGNHSNRILETHPNFLNGRIDRIHTILNVSSCSEDQIIINNLADKLNIKSPIEPII